ncbi:DUF6193 family natural product biosynthesis protein [Streptomyces sp. NPDC053513]|uniref:DUF6193 family natural product biosynthesis protein n=1 Tax=unclassified Streptomyces TaxID=2593676 RepID=UPI0037D480E3
MTFYPEVVKAGSLQNALQAVTDDAGYGLAVELMSSPGWRRMAARVKCGDQGANVLMARGERSFIVDCWASDVRMASGNTSDLTEAAGALHTWLEGPQVGELVARWPFLRTWELAKAHERGEAVPVRWRQLREAAARTPDTGLHELVEAAFVQERLRVLSPGRNMHWLTFSRRAAPPICRDLPQAMPLKNGRYRVRFADGRLQELDSAAEAVTVLIGGLPDDAMPRP